MSDDPPRPAPRDDQRSCRKCGHIHERALPRCPACGAYPGRRRRLSPSAKWHQRIAERIRTALPWFRGNRIYVLYVGGGLLAGAALRPLIMFLADFSMPEGWREARALSYPSLELFLDPFLAAGETLLRWLYAATIGLVISGVTWLYETALIYPSAVAMAIMGAGAGFLLARRRQRRRRRR